MKSYTELMGESALAKAREVNATHKQIVSEVQAEKAKAKKANNEKYKHDTEAVLNHVKAGVKAAYGGGRYREDVSGHVVKHERNVEGGKKLVDHFNKVFRKSGAHEWSHKGHTIRPNINSEHGDHVHISHPWDDKIKLRD